MTFPFPTFVPVVAAGGSATSAFTDSATDNSNSTTYTFSSQSFGSAFAGRVIVVAIGTRQNSARSISSVTIGGVTATPIATANETSGGADMCALYAAVVATGTTGDVVVTFSGSMLRCGIGVLAITGASGASAHDTGTDTDASAGGSSTTVDVPANGTVIAVQFGNATAYMASMSGVTEDMDTTIEVAANGMCAGHENLTSSETGRSISVTVTTGTAQQAMAVASWGP